MSLQSVQEQLFEEPMVDYTNIGFSGVRNDLQSRRDRMQGWVALYLTLDCLARTTVPDLCADVREYILQLTETELCNTAREFQSADRPFGHGEVFLTVTTHLPVFRSLSGSATWTSPEHANSTEPSFVQFGLRPRVLGPSHGEELFHQYSVQRPPHTGPFMALSQSRLPHEFQRSDWRDMGERWEGDAADVTLSTIPHMEVGTPVMQGDMTRMFAGLMALTDRVRVEVSPYTRRGGRTVVESIHSHLPVRITATTCSECIQHGFAQREVPCPFHPNADVDGDSLIRFAQYASDYLAGEVSCEMSCTVSVLGAAPVTIIGYISPRMSWTESAQLARSLQWFRLSMFSPTVNPRSPTNVFAGEGDRIALNFHNGRVMMVRAKRVREYRSPIPVSEADYHRDLLLLLVTDSHEDDG